MRAEVMKFIVPFLIAGFLVTTCAGKLLNEEVTIEGEIIGPVLRLKCMVKMRNDGRGNFRGFQFAVPPSFKQTDLRVVEKDAPLVSLVVEENSPESMYTEFKIKLSDSIAPSKTKEFIIYLDILNAVTPVRDEVRHMEKPFYLMRALWSFFSPYETDLLKVIYRLNSEPVNIYEGAPKSARVDKRHIFLGPYSKIPPYSEKLFSARFLEKGPLLKMSLFEKKISISHWGAATVVEEVTIRNVGAKVTEFSRLEHFAADQTGGMVNTAKSLPVYLPKDAYNVYYEDLIGNITSSRLREPTASGRYFEPFFRFPLLGGWKNYYWFGYTMPLSGALKIHNGVYVVKVNAQPTVSDPLQVDKAFFRVTLPEGAYDVKLVETEPSVRALEAETSYPTLSYLGKKQFSAERSDFVADPASPAAIYIFYRFSSIHLLLPIAVLALILFGILVLVLVVRHSDLKIDRNSDKEDDDLALYKEIQKLVEVENSFVKLADAFNNNVINYGNKDETVKYKQDQNRLIGTMKDSLKDLEYVYSEIVKLDAGEKGNAASVSALRKAIIDRYAKLGNVAVQLIEGKVTPKEAETDARKINDEIDICSERIVVAQSSLTSHL